MEHADEGTNEVLGPGVCAKGSAIDGSLGCLREGGMDDAASSFNEARGTAWDGVHGGKDEHLAGDVVDEKKHPGAESFQRRQAGSEAFFGVSELFDTGAVDRFDQGFARGKVTIEGAGTDAGTAGDVIKRGVGSVLSEDMPGDFQDAIAVALGVGSGRPRRGGR